MKNKLVTAASLLLLVVWMAVSFAAEVVGGKKSTSSSSLGKRGNQINASGKVGDAYLFHINNIQMPMSYTGVMGNVTVGGVTEGRFDGKGFLFSGGFFISGKAGNQEWASGTATASRIEDYLPGRINRQADDDAQLYVVDGLDKPFSESWQAWADAVKLGADFYDGDNNGVYEPVDLNGNGEWDADEDRPDLLGDQTAWCVYNDGKNPADRRWIEAIPRGIEIQQSTFGFRSAGLLGNMIFMRYRIFNRGTNAATMDSVYFAVWADPDLGTYTDDLVGCDTLRNGGFTWNDEADDTFGPNPPCFYVDFFQGPIAYIPGVTFTDVNANGVYDEGVDTPLTTASNRYGPVKGVDLYPGAKNLGLSSFVNYVQSDPVRGDPSTIFEARSFMLGRLKDRTPVNPCRDQFGTVFGIPCGSVPNQFWYSGSVVPAPGVGWIYTTPGDVRQMQNVGPFQLVQNEPVDITVAYIVGRGANARTSVGEAQRISDFAQFIYDINFAAPPPPPSVSPSIRTTENTIELIWDTAPHVNFVNKTPAWDLRFQGYEVYMYNTNSTAEVEGGVQNRVLIAKYDIADKIDDILSDDVKTGERDIVFTKGIQLDQSIYSTSARGRIALTITLDPFTGTALVKGKPYFISVSSYAINHDALRVVDPTAPTSNYYLDGTALVGATGNPATILNAANNGIRPGVDFNDPYQIETEATPRAGNAGDGTVVFDEVEKAALTGHDYQVSFYKDVGSELYQVFWRVTDMTTNNVRLDSLRIPSLAPPNNFASVKIDGFVVRVYEERPALKAVTYSGGSAWYRAFDNTSSGTFYTGTDLDVRGTPVPTFNRFSSLVSAENLRNVEIRFGPTQKVYRYVQRLAAWLYAEDPRHGLTNPSGFIDVPFQVWLNDPKTGESRQLAAAIFESRLTADAIWDPGTNITNSREYIVVFGSNYNTTPQIQYTGGTYEGATLWADIRGWTPPAAWTPATISDEQRAIAANPWADGIYVIGLERNVVGTDTLFYRSGDVFTLPVAHPFTSSDVFTFKTNKQGEALAQSAKTSQFDMVNVFPNPLFAYNPTGSRVRQNSDNAFITFSNLPQEVSVYIYTLSGSLVRTLTTQDKALGASSPFLDWDLENEDGLRVASGLYLARVVSPGLGEKVLKVAIIMPQKQIQYY